MTLPGIGVVGGYENRGFERKRRRSEGGGATFAEVMGGRGHLLGDEDKIPAEDGFGEDFSGGPEDLDYMIGTLEVMRPFVANQLFKDELGDFYAECIDAARKVEIQIEEKDSVTIGGDEARKEIIKILGMMKTQGKLERVGYLLEIFEDHRFYKDENDKTADLRMMGLDGVIPPELEGSWTVIEHSIPDDVYMGRLSWNKKRQERSVVSHNRSFSEKAIEKLEFLNASILGYLLSHQDQIPESWKEKVVYFWGTVFEDQSGENDREKDRYILGLYWDKEKEKWERTAANLNSDNIEKGVAATLARPRY